MKGSLLRPVRKPFTPYQIGGLVRWFDATRLPRAADSSSLSTWPGSIAAQNLTLPVGGTPSPTAPIYRTGPNGINGLPAVQFNGTANVLTGTRALDDDVFDVFAVVSAAAQDNKSLLNQHPNAPDVGRTVLLSSGSSGAGTTAKVVGFFNNGSSFPVTSTTTAFDSTPKLIRFTSNGSGTSSVHVNAGAAEGTVTGQTWTPLNWGLNMGANGSTGNDWGNHWAGKVGEVLIYSKAHGAGAIQVIRYLSAKWGLKIA